LKSKIGVSWISVDRACKFLQEIPTWDLNSTATQAVQVWENDILNKVDVFDKRNSTLLRMFYSALYRMSLLPSNRTGENPYWDDGVGYMDDICE
jgi:putative alpha-1,2-mannosidase